MAHLRSPQADFDLDEIWLWVATESGSFEIADRLIDTLTRRFELLANQPFAGRTRDHDLLPGLRSFPVGNYLIVYRLAAADVLILRVLRGSRSIPTLFGA